VDSASSNPSAVDVSGSATAILALTYSLLRRAWTTSAVTRVVPAQHHDVLHRCVLLYGVYIVHVFDPSLGWLSDNIAKVNTTHHLKFWRPCGIDEVVTAQQRFLTPIL